MSNIVPGRRCEDCGRYLEVKTVQQNSRSAPPEHWGLRYFICKRRNTQASSLHCNFFYWVDPPPWSPPTTSRSQSSGIMPGRSGSFERCTVHRCNGRKNKLCDKVMCKRHCVQGGGCTVHPSSGQPNNGAVASIAATPPAPSPPPALQVAPSSPAPSYLTIPLAQPSSPLHPPQISITASTPPTASTSQLPVSSNVSSPRSPSAPTTPGTHLTSSTLPPATPVAQRVLPAPIPRLSPRKASHIIDSFNSIYDAEQEIMRQKKIVHEEKLETQQAERNAVTVHCWLRDNAAPTHDRFQSSGVPPRFKFTRSNLQILGLAGDVSVTPALTRFRVWSPKDGYWLGAGENDSFPTSPGQHLFVVGGAVEYFSDINSFIASIMKKPAVLEPHMRSNLTKDRESVRTQARAALLVSASNSTVRTPGKRPQPRPIAPHPTLGSGSSKRSRSPSPVALTRSATSLDTGNPCATKKRKPTPTTPCDNVIELGSSGDEQPMVLPQGMRGTVFSLVSEEDSESGSNGDKSRSSSPLPEFPFKEIFATDEAAKTRRWPSDYSCVELDAGFSRINALHAQDREHGRKPNTKVAFADAFPHSRFVAATFSENKSRWISAPVAERARALDAGMTKDGKWEVFAARNPDLKGKVRSERKKEKRRVVGGSDHETNV